MKRRVLLLVGILVWVFGEWPLVAQPPAGATAGFDAYTEVVEGRLARQHGGRAGFLVPVDEGPLRRGELVVEQVTPAGGAELPGALLHHWRGTVFVPGATGVEMERLMRDFADYPKVYAPEVLQVRGVVQRGNRVQAEMRVRQKHVLTVVMDTAYDVTFGRLDAGHGYSLSRSTRVAEVEGAGTAAERRLSAGEEHGFLWRQNTYWSWEETDGGVVLQVESVSLSRGIPRGLGWAVGPLVESVPRESVEFTLRATAAGLRSGGGPPMTR
jgi:hypothetical protein